MDKLQRFQKRVTDKNNRDKNVKNNIYKESNTSEFNRKMIKINKYLKV